MDNKTANALITDVVIALALRIASAIPMIWLSGWVGTYLWVWYITPTFNLPTPSIFEFYGFTLFFELISLSLYRTVGDVRDIVKKNDKTGGTNTGVIKAVLQQILTNAFTFLFIFIFGWVIHFFA